MSGIGWELMLSMMGGLLVVLMGIGVPVAFAFLALNLAGAYLILGGESGLRLLALSTTEAVTSFSLVPIPLFILMGEILLHTGLATRAIHAIERLIVGIPGRLSLVAVVSGGVFASLSGSSIANTAVLGRVLLPEMLRLGYHPLLSIGPILAIGGVAMLIPPSASPSCLAASPEYPFQSFFSLASSRASYSPRSSSFSLLPCPVSGLNWRQRSRKKPNPCAAGCGHS
jgi:TRAP-type mannitol/chloroaromatic compound transport system permease large subunit